MGTVHSLRPGLSTIYNGTGSTEKFQRVATTPEQKAPVTIQVTVAQREGDDPTVFGRRVGEALAFQLGKVAI